MEAEEEVNRIMASIDKNKSGKIDYSEFVMATCDRRNMLSKDRLETVFKMFDKDGNGNLTIDEIKRLFNVQTSDDEIIAEII